jgi:ParB family chromosome partitioning protein
MNKSKGGLGRGLGSLLSMPSATPAGSIHGSTPTAPAPSAFIPEPIDIATEGELRIKQVSPADIVENPRQPRRHFAPEELAELEASIAEHGILQPLIVSELSPGKYELIAGERRLRASRGLGLKEIPVVIRPMEDDRTKLELALIENIQRADLNAVEEAQAYKALIEDFDLRQEDVAKRVGKSRPAVANALRLLELDEEMLQALIDGRIMKSHARTLLAEPVLSRRQALFQDLLKGGITVREVEARAGSARQRARFAKDPNVGALEAELREKFGTKVTIDMQNGGGKVSIYFYAKEDLKSLVERLARD